MKRIIAIFTILAFLLSVSACGVKNEKSEREFSIVLENTTENLQSIVASLAFDGSVFSTLTMQNTDGTLLSGGESLTLIVQKSDIPKGARLSDFSISFSVTMENGSTELLQILSFTPEWGESYGYRILFDGNYQVFPTELPNSLAETLLNSSKN